MSAHHLRRCAMATRTDIVDLVRDELRKEPQIVSRLHAISLHYDNGVLFMEGELDTVAAKQLALERATRLACVLGIVDRLCVTPSMRMTDSEISSLLGATLMQERMLSRYRITCADGDLALRSITPPHGTIGIAVRDGVVTLSGEVSSLDHKRVAGLLAWWNPGRRDVVNGIAVEPPEEDTDCSMANAVRTVLEMDHLLSAGQIRVSAREGNVLLSGFVTNRAERERAESDAWCVFGVDGVRNAIVVRLT